MASKPPKAGDLNVQGAGVVPFVTFAEQRNGVVRYRLATVRRMVFRATGGTEWTTSTEFYLLSPEGKVYRGHGLPEVPGGNLSRFDYETARRKDPGNVGTYSTDGSRVTLLVGDERISAALGGDELEIRGTKFRRSVK